MGDHSHSDYQHGHMDIAEHKATFAGFGKATEWGCVLVAATVGLFTFDLAIGLGPFIGILVYVLVCVGAGFMLKMGPAWWATTIVTTVVWSVVLGLFALFLPMNTIAALMLPALA
jgi:hypothetical protein